MKEFTNHIIVMNTAIELAKEEEFALLFLDLASRGGFVDPHEWSREDHLVNTDWNCAALVELFKMLNRGCPGLIEFKKQKGFIGMIKFPAMRMSELGMAVAEMLKNKVGLEK